MTTQEKVEKLLMEYVDFMKNEGAIFTTLTVKNLEWALENSEHEIQALSQYI